MAVGAHPDYCVEGVTHQTEIDVSSPGLFVAGSDFGAAIAAALLADSAGIASARKELAESLKKNTAWTGSIINLLVNDGPKISDHCKNVDGTADVRADSPVLPLDS